ncbi:hypothetical protein BS50DRAFT_651694 [Corynespora cassiicola Philippines]|uniref:Uncharacterized protein n=1 Tax=Corynespora cassiicola Philippines TaxID=1448308 RepID=A0A2T2N7Q3_CORCC|nr:hypothetical protein BS50DRAFT_651694 [Corynespora cassiicola Philippines]
MGNMRGRRDLGRQSVNRVCSSPCAIPCLALPCHLISPSPIHPHVRTPTANTPCANHTPSPPCGDPHRARVLPCSGKFAPCKFDSLRFPFAPVSQRLVSCARSSLGGNTAIRPELLPTAAPLAKRCGRRVQRADRGLFVEQARRGGKGNQEDGHWS